MRSLMTILGGLVMLFGVSQAEAGSGLIGSTADGVDLYKAPKASIAATVLISPIPETFLVRQVTIFPGSPDMTTVCFFLVKGYADKERELWDALKPANVLQMSCQNGR